jgi:type I restriction enzyme S subunit
MNELKASKYQAYPEYKDSGVEWLDEIPKHWVLSRVKYIAPFQVGWTPPTKNDENFVGNNLWANISDLKDKIITNTSKQISDKAAKEASMSITPKGSLMYSFKLSVGAVSFAGDNMYTNEAIASFLDSARLPLSYLYYALPKFVIENASTNIYGARILNQELISNAQVLEPTFEEAENIAKFLDHETAKIDTLIEKQQQLIKLLKEKRQAVISHAVTKGISYEGQLNVPMKDSGVEWLGEVPEHWLVTRVKYITTLFEQGWSPQCDSRPAEAPEYGVLKVGCVNYGSFKATENKALPNTLEPKLQYLIQKDDLLISRANTKELVGSAAVVDYDYGHLILCDKLYRLRLKDEYLPELVSLFLSISDVREQIELGATGASHSMQNIGQDTIRELFYVAPPKGEAIELLAYIKNRVSRFDQTLLETAKQIELLKERRTALISAAGLFLRARETVD